MAQSPFLADQLQIEPGSSGTRLINMAAGGELQFQDPDITAVLLKNLVGVRNITDVFVVGSGDGAAYSSIQDAFDAVSNSSSSSSPSLVLVYPGTYTENLVLQKDGAYVLVVGDVVLVVEGGGKGCLATIEEVHGEYFTLMCAVKDFVDECSEEYYCGFPLKGTRFSGIYKETQFVLHLTALAAAAAGGHLEAVRLLLAHGAKADGPSGIAALRWAKGDAMKALKELQHAELDGHKVELKYSTRSGAAAAGGGGPAGRDGKKVVAKGSKLLLRTF